MSTRGKQARRVPGAARVFNDLQANDALLPGHASAMRRTSAVLLALLVLAAVPLYWAANAAGLIGDVPTAVAKGSNSGPGGGGDDDDNSGPGSGDDDDDDRTMLKTDDTSRNGHSTRGTTNDNDTRTQLGTDDTSRNGNSTRGTTNDNDTNTNTRNSATGTQTRTRGQTQTRTRTGS
jgi:hypothetical protein